MISGKLLNLMHSPAFRLAFVLSLCGLFLLASGQEVAAQADPLNSARQGVDGGDASDIGDVMRVVANVLSLISGAVAVIFIIIAGFRFINSNGDSSKVAAARSSLIYAIVGVLVVVFAQIIVSFVLTESTSAPAPTPGPPRGGPTPI